MKQNDAMKKTFSFLLVLAFCGFSPWSPPESNAAPPEGFTRDFWPGDWGEILGIVPTGDGRYIAWEKAGRAWTVGPDGLASVEPLLDISDEVGNWRDHGMLGLAADPDFATNGHVYLFYVVDRHHLLNAGTSAYDPDTDDYFSASIGRITRYTATAKSDRSVVDPTTRKIILGATIDDGFPILHQSHAVGSLTFGKDGTLLASMGDSSSYGAIDTGGQVDGGWIDQALADGIITPREDIGAFRAQQIDCLAGKILRIDPETGDGVTSNPWYSPAAPRIARSRLWTLGLRNGFRITMDRNTGSLNPADGDPGTVIYGDVGWSTREEAGLIPTGGMNLGWPLFEGLDPNGGYWATDVENSLVPNPLADGDCPSRFRYRDLLVEAGRVPSNPCDPGWLKPSDWNGPTTERVWAGWTGDDYLDFGGSSGEWIEFELTVPDSTPRRYGLRWANGSSGSRPIDILLDGKSLQTFQAPSTEAWINWRIHWFELSLTPGTHVLRLVTTINNGPNIDCLETPDRVFTPLDPTSSFAHRRPEIEWRHNLPQTRIPNFDSNGTAGFSRLEQVNAPVQGEAFGGNSVTGGAMVMDARWPAEWRGMIFADYVFGWMRVARLDDQGNPVEIRMFDGTAGSITSIVHDPFSGDLLATRFEQSPIRYSPPRAPCPADLDGDLQVAGGDIGVLLSNWGGSGLGDLDQDGTVGGSDFGLLLSAFGPCQP